MTHQEASQAIRRILEECGVGKAHAFVPGETTVQYAGNVFGPEETQAAMDVLLRGWLGLSECGLRLEQELSAWLGQPGGVLANSGSSANLLCISALLSPRFRRPLKPGDEVITHCAGFPTTVNPIIQRGLVPVFVDVEIGSYNLMLERLERCVTPKTRAVSFAHTLGNPVDMEFLTDFCTQHDLVLLEDCCDALGGTFNRKRVGSFGEFSTLSMYPSHHITIGEGGFAAAATEENREILRSLRDWGRACWCGGENSLLAHGTCGNRFSKWLDGMDVVVDHKYIYSEIGFNLRPIELQAAIGLEQVKRLDGFIAQRRKNFKRYYDFFKQYEDLFHLPVWDARANPSWFAFPLTIKKTSPFSKPELVQYLESKKVQTRDLFAGNLLRHSAYRNVPHRVVGDLNNSDLLITNTFFIGVYPGLTDAMIEYVCQVVREFMKDRT